MCSLCSRNRAERLFQSAALTRNHVPNHFKTLIVSFDTRIRSSNDAANFNRVTVPSIVKPCCIAYMIFQVRKRPRHEHDCA